jgi:hypothetical protein
MLDPRTGERTRAPREAQLVGMAETSSHRYRCGKINFVAAAQARIGVELTSRRLRDANTQTVARTPLSDTSCLPEDYALSLNGAVPECTRRPRRSDRASAGDIAAGCRRAVPEFTRSDACAQAHRQWSVEVQRSRYAERGSDYGDYSMFFIVSVIIALVAVGSLPRMRVPGGVNAADLGWMSEQWLAEHRASHPT